MIEDDELEADEKARIAALHKSAPERIWLQIDPEAEQFDWWDAQTWCSDQINDTDLEYVRADVVESLRQQLETERMRLAACGVVVLSNTPESAAKARDMLPEYRSASCDDVARAVDREMELSKQLAASKPSATPMKCGPSAM